VNPIPRTRASAALAALAAMALLAASCGGQDPDVLTAVEEKSKSVTSEQAEVTTSTIPDDDPRAPLTGLPIDEARKIYYLRPVAAVKIDNAPQAMPHEGLNQADMVIEVLVEGISRLIAIYHSQVAESIGPTRSARHSDPDLLALFGKPLFAWSGANENVASGVYKTPWIVNANWDRAEGAYERRRDRSAPHNLFTSSEGLYEYTEGDQPPAPPVFEFLEEGTQNAGSFPVAGASVQIGDTTSQWVWVPELNQFVRWQYGVSHRTDDEEFVSASNVVILQTKYGRGPTARSVGEGDAWVLTTGSVIEGRWIRPKRTAPYQLVQADGTPILLNPGRTWVQLPRSEPELLTPETASSLLESAQ
jgi:hypothetical protein